MTENQMRDHEGAAIVYLNCRPQMIGDKGYDSDAFRDALAKPRHHALHPAPSQSSVARDFLQGLV